MNKYTCKLLLTILFFVFFNQNYANNLRQISNHDGLSNSAILSICQDKDGFMWFGSCDGLNMFNGINIQVYKPSTNAENLSGNLIESIMETEPDILWVHTNYGLNRLDKKRNLISSYNQFKGRYFIEKDKNNTIFIINEDNGIYYYHKGTDSFKKILIPDLKYSNILDFTITSNDILYTFTRDGINPCFVIKRDENGEISLSPEKVFKHTSNLLFCFHEKDYPDIIYFIDNTYTLYEYNLVEKKKYYVYNLEKGIRNKGEISSIIKFHNDYFIGFKTNGLLQLKNSTDKAESYTLEDIGINSGIFCLIKDKYQDLVWVGTDGQGVYMYSYDMYSLRSITFNSFAPYIEKPVRSLYLDKDNTLWIGTKGDGILKISKFNINTNLSEYATEHVSASNSPLSDNSVYVFSESKKDILWIGCEEGLNYYSYKSNKIQKIKIESEGEQIKYIHAICELDDSTLWLATVGTGIIKARLSWNGDNPSISEVEKITVHDGTDFYNYFFTLYKEDDSTLWFGNRGYGAYYIKHGSTELANQTFDNLWANQTVNDVYSIGKDYKNNLWFGTSMGLVKSPLDGEKKIFSEKNGFPNNTIHGILTDYQGNLWLSTNRGLVRFNIERENFHTYDYLNGLQVIEYSDGAAFKDSISGNLYFGGVNGFTIISETGLYQREYQPAIHFDNLMVFGVEKNIYDFIESNNEGNVLRLNYNQNFFSISFTALDYINGNNYNYYYRLDDLSKQWIDNGVSNTASFTSIPPGEYTLYIKYKNRLTGVESPVYSIVLKITPPWYMSPWAYLLYAILFVALIIYVVRAFIRWETRKKRIAMKILQRKHEEEVYESKLRFFTNIAHEFCTPLTLIYGPCSRILSHNGSDPYVKKYTHLIQRNAERMNDLIQNLIEFRRIETGNRTPQIEELDIFALVSEISDSFNELSESEGVIYDKNIQAPLRWNSDKNFIYTVVINLISNAFKYTSENGYIEICAYEKTGSMYISVSNTGKGIKAEDLGRIFDRYSILDNFENQEGKSHKSRNGLGLAISYSMIKLLDGTINVTSTENGRTDFVICLPYKEITRVKFETNKTLPEHSFVKDSEPVVEIPKYEFDQSKLTVLIIDDDVEILWLISEIFNEDYNVIPVNNPSQISNLLLEIHPNIIICDVMMPKVNGIELAKSIKTNKKTAHIPLILISAKHSIEEQIEGLATGAEMYIAKPFNTDYLRASVELLLSRKETLKDYFNSPLSAFDLKEGKMTHKENSKFMQDILDIISKNIMNPKLSTQFIASELNISPRHLYRKLGEIGEQSPSDMIKDARMHIARNLLLNTKMTIDEIIYKSGFVNRATFFRTFFQKYGCTPKEYREQNISTNL